MPDTSTESVAQKMMSLGALLHSQLSRTWRRPNEEVLSRIHESEKDLLECLYGTKSKPLQAALDYNNNGKHLDELAVRITCAAAFAQFASQNPIDAHDIARVVAVDDDSLQPLRARQSLFRLCVRGALVLEESYYHRESVALGRPLLEFFRCSSLEPLVFGRQTVAQARRDREIAEQKRDAKKHGFTKIKSARQIYDELSQFVVGQDALKEALAVAGRNTILRREMSKLGKRLLPPKQNVLVIGASGSGKTYTCECLSRVLGLPYASMDVSQCTASGYIGDDVSGILYLLSQAASAMGVSPEAGGVVFLDEIDKIAASHYESASTVGVQFECLRLLDGGSVSYPLTGLCKWGSSGAVMDTSNLLVACGGAYSWLNQFWQGKKANIGFASDGGGGNGAPDEVRQLLATRGGKIPEMVNRFSAIVRTSMLTADDIADILMRESGPMAEYRATLAAEGRSLTVDDGAALAIGQWSIESGLMGRGARAALEKLLRDPLFTGEPKDIVLTREGVVQVLGTPNGR